MPIWTLLNAYRQARRLHFSSRAALERHQAHRLGQFAQNVLKKSPYFQPYASLSPTQWPLMDKRIMLEAFDRMNTVGLTRDEAMAHAFKSEQDRAFSGSLKGVTIGLSSGTSGQRGLFAVSAVEQSRWAGVMLAKMLPDGLFARESVALFLRANSRLYQSINTPWLRLHYYDLFEPMDKLLEALGRQKPTIIVAPAQVLGFLAQKIRSGSLAIRPKKVISAAEVLNAADKIYLESVFTTVGEVYQATEGFLAATCEFGKLHLNEEYVLFEKEYVGLNRFVPIITDFTRSTQPIVRYRLNDVLLEHPALCGCGRITQAIDAIEGREDDVFVLPAKQGQSVTVFADVTSRALAQVLPVDADYRLVQQQNTMTLMTTLTPMQQHQVKNHLNLVWAKLGVDAQQIIWKFERLPENTAWHQKRRRLQKLN